MNYETYKKNKQTEFKEHEEANTFYAYYPFEVEKALKKLNATKDEFTNVGASYFYVRTSALNKGEEITEKYNKIFLTEIATNETFLYEFLIDEFTRINAFKRDEYNKVFEYNNIPLEIEDLTTEQLKTYEKAITDYEDINKEDIKIYKEYKEIFN